MLCYRRSTMAPSCAYHVCEGSYSLVISAMTSSNRRTDIVTNLDLPDPPFTNSTYDRISSSLHILLPMLASLNPAWMEQSNEDAKSSPFQGAPMDQHSDGPEFELPSLRDLFAKIPNAKSLINPCMLDTADKSVFVDDPWDFERYKAII